MSKSLSSLTVELSLKFVAVLCELGDEFSNAAHIILVLLIIESGNVDAVRRVDI